MSKPTSFEADILPLFTQRDIQGMSKAFNLASYDEVRAHAAAIFDRIRGIGGPHAAAAAERRGSVGPISYRSLREVGGGRLSAVGDQKSSRN